VKKSEVKNSGYNPFKNKSWIYLNVLLALRPHGWLNIGVQKYAECPHMGNGKSHGVMQKRPLVGRRLVC
jgi:hypothetical protein